MLAVKTRILQVGRLLFQHESYVSGLNSDAVIYIPAEIVRRADRNGLTLFLQSFWIAKDLLFYREPPQHKISIFSTVNRTVIGKRDYNAGYVKSELILKEADLRRLTELLRLESS